MPTTRNLAAGPPTFIVLLMAGFFVLAACETAPKEDPWAEADARMVQEQIDAEEAEAAEAAALEAAKPAPPKVTEDAYIELMTRSVLIREKYPENPDTAEAEIDALYDKSGITLVDIRDFERRTGLDGLARLQPRIQELMQVLQREYR